MQPRECARTGPIPVRLWHIYMSNTMKFHESVRMCTKRIQGSTAIRVQEKRVLNAAQNQSGNTKQTIGF